MIVDGSSSSRKGPLHRLHAVAHAQGRAPDHYQLGLPSNGKPVALAAHLHGNHGNHGSSKAEDLLHSPPTSIADFTGKTLLF